MTTNSVIVNTSDFERAMKDLLELAKKILLFGSEDNAFATKKEKKKTGKNPILKALENYIADYNLSDEEGNKDDVVVTYRKIKVALLKGWKIDDWLKTSNIAIYSAASEPDEKRKIMLSTIYTTACRHRDQSRDALKGLPIEAFDGHEELLFPSKFLLYMYRCFLFALNGEEYGDDITKLNANVSDLEKELKLTPVVSNVGSEVVPNGLKVGNDFMGGFFDIAKDLVGKMGVQVPEGAQTNINNTNIIETAVSIFTKPETKDLLTDIGESMKGAKDFGDAFQKVFTKFQDPSSLDKLKRMTTGILPTEMMSSSGAEGKQEVVV